MPGLFSFIGMYVMDAIEPESGGSLRNSAVLKLALGL